MTRLIVVLTFGFVLAVSASAYEPAKPTASAPKAVKSADPDDVAELLAMLDETESADTFLVTLEALVGIEPERKGLLVAVIRNADRLGLLKGLSTGKLISGQEVLADAITKLIEVRAESKNKTNRTAPASNSRAYPPPAIEN